METVYHLLAQYSKGVVSTGFRYKYIHIFLHRWVPKFPPRKRSLNVRRTQTQGSRRADN